jgi:AcrR family transcriptional regulator
MTSPAKKTVKKTVKSPSATLEPTLEPPASPALEPKTKLSRDLILQTAAKIADRDGIQALTMRKLAQELSVEAMSIYHHVAHKNDLRDGMINLVFTRLNCPLERSIGNPHFALERFRPMRC